MMIFITFLIGRDSPCYAYTTRGDNWDIARPYIQNAEHLIEIIYDMFINSNYNKVCAVEVKLFNIGKSCSL